MRDWFRNEFVSSSGKRHGSVKILASGSMKTNLVIGADPTWFKNNFPISFETSDLYLKSTVDDDILTTAA